MEEKKSSRPRVPQAYHAYIVATAEDGDRRSCFLWSYDQTAWVLGQHLQLCSIMGGMVCNLHRFRAPAPPVSDPNPSDVLAGDDMPW